MQGDVTCIYGFIIKDTDEQPGEGGHRARSRRTSRPHGDWDVPPSQHVGAFTKPGAPQTPSFGVFIQAPLCTHEGCTQWQLVTDSVSSPLKPGACNEDPL